MKALDGFDPTFRNPTEWTNPFTLNRFKTDANSLLNAMCARSGTLPPDCWLRPNSITVNYGAKIGDRAEAIINAATYGARAVAARCVFFPENARRSVKREIIQVRM